MDIREQNKIRPRKPDLNFVSEDTELLKMSNFRVKEEMVIK